MNLHTFDGRPVLRLPAHPSRREREAGARRLAFVAAMSFAALILWRLL